MRSVSARICSGTAWAACLMAAGSGGGHAQPGPHQDFVCTSGTSVRIISVYNFDSAGGAHGRGSCRVDYAKDGRTTTVYASTTGRAYCAAKATLLVTNLARANYSCRVRTIGNGEDVDPPARPSQRTP